MKSGLKRSAQSPQRHRLERRRRDRASPLEESMFEFESSNQEDSLCFSPRECRGGTAHAGVQILADLERDFDFFREWRRDMLGYLILRRIETRIGRKSVTLGPELFLI